MQHEFLNAAIERELGVSNALLSVFEYDGYIYWDGLLGRKFSPRCTFYGKKDAYLNLLIPDLKDKLIRIGLTIEQLTDLQEMIDIHLSGKNVRIMRE